MMIFRSRAAAVMAAAAALSMTATPAMARGWGGGWGHRHHDGIDGGDVLAGLLVIGGIAAIASVASNGKAKQSRDADYRYPDDGARAEDTSREPPAGYGSDRGDEARDYGSQADSDRPDDRPDEDRQEAGLSDANLNVAVDSCVGEVERGDGHVDGVDSVNRDGDGWRVAGRMTTGRDFSCSVDRDGRIRGVTVDGGAA